MSQHTPCIHKGLARGTLRPPSTPRLHAPYRARPRGLPPPNPRAGALMADRRTGQLHLRVSPAEAAAWRAKAEAAGVPLSDLLRQAMARTRTWTAAAAAVERERTRQVARIGNNLNQIARWANTHADRADAVEVIAHLVAIEQEIARLARFPDERPDAR